MFWDGRATGDRLGDPLAEQAQGPFLNPREQALPDAAAVIAKVQASSYAQLFEEVAGMGAAIWLPANTSAAYDVVGRSIAAYERSSEVNPFSSKYDAWVAGKAKLTAPEMQGFRLFTNKGKCDNCHVPPLFTDFTYDNLGIPKNLENPVYLWIPTAFAWVDPGLGGFLQASGQPLGRLDGRGRQAQGADAAQRRPAAVARLRQGLRAQRLLQEPPVHRPLLQHARCGELAGA